MRKLAVTVAMTLAVLALAPAASAKEPGEASITGPGLSSPVRMRFDMNAPDETLFQFLDWSGYFRSKHAQRPEGPLGPRYEVTVSWGQDLSRPTTVHTMSLYPYAEGQPRTFTPEQQGTSAEDHRALSGWHTGPLSLRSMLVDMGLPERAPQAPTASLPPPSLDPFPWGFVIGFGLMTAMLLIGVRASRRKPRLVA